MKLNRAYFILIVLLPIFSHAQERGIPVYSDYLTDNLYLLHPSTAGAYTTRRWFKGSATKLLRPSMSGSSPTNKIRLTARKQWFDVENAPSVQTLSISGRIGEKIGVGTILFNDSNGNFSEQGAYLTFAYHLKLSEGRRNLNVLSFGINVGIGQSKLDETEFRLFDPAVSGGVLSDTYFNIDLGMSYYYHKFFVHLTAKNVLPQKSDLYLTEDISSELSNQRQYIANLGYAIIPFGTKWIYEPSILLQVREQTAQTNIDLNFKVYRGFDFGQLWGGLSYRRSLDRAENAPQSKLNNQNLQYLTPFLGINYKDFMFAYTYSYQMNSVVISTSGFHQITLGYNFGK